MILISAGLVLAAVVLLIAGFVLAKPFLIMWSIVVSVLSALFLVIGALLRRHELFPGGRAGATATPPDPRLGHPQPPHAGQAPVGMPPSPQRPPTPQQTAPQPVPRRPAGGGIAPDAIVLVIPGRKRYHVPGCRQLIGRDPEELTFVEAREEGFSPCTSCLPDAALGGRQLPPAADPEPVTHHQAASPETPVSAEPSALFSEATRDVRPPAPVAAPKPAPAASTPSPEPGAGQSGGWFAPKSTPSGPAQPADDPAASERSSGTAVPPAGPASSGGPAEPSERAKPSEEAKPAKEEDAGKTGEPKPTGQAERTTESPADKPERPAGQSRPAPVFDETDAEMTNPHMRLPAIDVTAKPPVTAARPGGDAPKPAGKTTGSAENAAKDSKTPKAPEPPRTPAGRPERDDEGGKPPSSRDAGSPARNGTPKPADAPKAKDEPASEDRDGDDRPGTVKVIVGTRRYHSTACPLIRGAGDTGVETMSLAQAEAAGLTSCSVCQNDRESVS
ncbi:hypothetical protein [Nonomuraea typhae]|uniref:hypothetical protein n=1 Tax=Nonomuraea typhae TaxID=2603600 RepID=UPI0012F94DF0|nr:hypothetical protein [Nonomuraea typhae]